MSWRKAFVCPQKGNWAFFGTYSFHLCLLSAYYRLEMKNFSLENHHMINTHRPFCWWMTFTKVSTLFHPSPPKWLTWPLDVCGGVGYGWFCWFNLRIFSQTSLELEIFSVRYNGARFFSALYIMSDIFFSVGCFSQEFICTFFPSQNQPAGHFFQKSPITLSKVKWSAPKIHQTFGQLTDSDLSIISKGFWNNKGQNSQGERGGICFYLPLTGKYVRSYIWTDVWWRHNHIFSDG